MSRRFLEFYLDERIPLRVRVTAVLRMGTFEAERRGSLLNNGEQAENMFWLTIDEPHNVRHWQWLWFPEIAGERAIVIDPKSVTRITRFNPAQAGTYDTPPPFDGATVTNTGTVIPFDIKFRVVPRGEVPQIGDIIIILVTRMQELFCNLFYVVVKETTTGNATYNMYILTCKKVT